MNKIGWCDLTFNPVWGCRNKCEYCYARIFAKRFGSTKAEQEHYSHYWGNKRTFKDVINNIHVMNELSNKLINFEPTFLYGQYHKKLPKKPQRIFVGSMSEIAHWEKRWMEVILGRILCYPQHIFQFLTKYPDVYSKYDFPKNCWLGITVTDTENYNYYDSGHDDSSIHLAYQKFKISNLDNLKFICFEPLFNEISINLDGIDWIILGAETGNRKGKVIPEIAWIENIIEECKMRKIPIYLKDNLKNIYPDRIKEFPKGAKR